MNRSVAPRHGKAGLYDVPVLQYIVADQDSPGRQKSDHIRQKTNVLSLRRIHEDQVKAAVQSGQHFSRIALHQGNALLRSGFLEILPCDRDPLLVLFNRRDVTVLRSVLAHQ